MLGFLKKKKKEDAAADATVPPEETGDDAAPPPPKKKARKKTSLLKRIMIILLVLTAVTASAAVVYTFWFATPSKGEDGQRIYIKKPLVHVGLPQEMLKFSFEHFPGLYDALVAYNTEVTRIEKEIDRIEQIAQTYPEQQAIAEKEIKVWDKTLQRLKKAFIKLEKSVKETYVLFRVNKTQGLARVEEIRTDLEKTSAEALASVREMTDRLERPEKVPQGLIKGTIYKLKKTLL